MLNGLKIARFVLGLQGEHVFPQIEGNIDRIAAIRVEGDGVARQCQALDRAVGVADRAGEGDRASTDSRCGSGPD